MKSIIWVTVFALLFSCAQDNKIVTAEKQEMDSKEIRDCFQYIMNKDTVSLKTSIEGNKVTGELQYLFFEKDKSRGTIDGELKDGLLIADYTFQAEGTTSTRQVVFKKVEGGWKEGYGPMKEVEGRFVMSSLDSLDYSLSETLVPIGCR